jgi:putative ABC transport system permease protein
MGWTSMARKLKRWLPGGKERFRDEIQEELKQHVEELTQENLRAGMSPEEARRAAVLRFGNVGAISDGVQAEHRVFRMEEVGKDLRFGARMLRRTPGFTIVAVLTLALGIGGTTAVFSVVDGVVLRPLPVHDPDRLVIVRGLWRGEPQAIAAADFANLQAHTETLEIVAATENTSFTLEDERSPDRLTGQRVTGRYFDLFGVEPLLGRTFGVAEDEPGNAGVVVLSNAMWRARFNADPDVLGRTVRLSGRQHEIIGVMPAHFDLTRQRERLWVPMAFTPEQKQVYDEQPYLTYGRLKPGVTLEQARSDLSVLMELRVRNDPREKDGGRSFTVQRLDDALLEETRPAMYLLLGAVGLVLLIACVNVGTLQLARARSRRKEIAISAALGASTWRVARQLLTESLLLATAGGVLGLLFAHWMLKAIISRAPIDIPRITYATIDGRVLLLTFFLVLLAALITGAWAAARARRIDPGTELGFGRTSGGASVRDRLRGTLVTAEVAMALVLLVGAGLLIRSAVEANRVDLGFEPENLLVGRVSLPLARYGDLGRFMTAVRQIEAEAAALPGVQKAAVADAAPLSSRMSNGLIPEGKPQTLEYLIQSASQFVTPAYFATMRIPLLLGRNFTDADRADAPKVVVINQVLAAAAFPGEEPIGKRLSWGPEAMLEVVGVVANVPNYGITTTVPPQFYFPLAQILPDMIRWTGGELEVTVRTAADPTRHANDLRAMMQRVDPAVPVYAVGPIEERIATMLRQRRFTTMLLTSFAVLAVFLASIGIYGVLSYMVTQRTQEIGIRVALGASRRQVLRLVFGDGLRLVALGAAIGIGGALAVTRLMTDLLFRVEPHDSATFILSAVALVLLALLASYVPAARALRIEPTVALRNE